MQKTIKLKEVIALTGLSRATILRHVDKGTFPPYAVVGGISLWLADDIAQWQDKHVVQPIQLQKLMRKS